MIYLVFLTVKEMGLDLRMIIYPSGSGLIHKKGTLKEEIAWNNIFRL